MKFVGFDIETVGDLSEYALQAYRAIRKQAKISAASIATSSTAFGLLDPTIDQLTKILTQYQGQYIVAWNTCFDVSWLYAVGIPERLIEGVKWLDAMLLWMHTCREPESDNGPKRSWSLETAMKEFYPEHASFKEFTDFQTDSEEGKKSLLHRNKEDARFTAIPAERFWKLLTPPQRQAALIEARCIPMVARTYNQGIKIDVPALGRLKKKLTEDAATAYESLKTHYSEIDSINLGSPKQVGNLLYNIWGLTPPKFSAKGAPSTDKFALHDLAEKYPQAKLLRDYREATYNTAKYADATIKSLVYNGDGVVRPQMKIFGTYTGRAVYYSKQGRGKSERPSGIALHQWKRDTVFRELIIPPEGYDLVELDFAGQEFGLMAVASEDERMLALREDGEDAHSFMGAQVAGIDYKDLVRRVKAGDKEAAGQRKLGKFCNLSYQYRISAKAATVKAKVEYGLNLEESFVKQTQNSYKRAYPGVPDYWISAVARGQYNGYAETYAGRRIHFPKGGKDKNQKWAMESTCINYPIQGTGGDQKYLALSVARDELNQMEGYFYFDLHDGLYFILKKANSLKNAVKLRHLLSNLPYEEAWGVKFPIKFPVDCKIGPSWAALKEIE